jgi:hypothetical protein
MSHEHTSTEQWPPVASVRVHALTFLVAATRAGHKGTRLKHTTTNSMVEYNLDDTVRMLRELGPEGWVQFCTTSATRRSLPVSHWGAWAALVRRFMCECNAAPDESSFSDAVLIFLGLPQLYLDRKIKNTTLLDFLERQITVKALQATKQYSDSAMDDDERAVRQAQMMVDQGFVSKACKALGKNRVLDGSLPAVRETLQSKHPAGDFAMFDAPYVLPPYTGQEVDKLANGSAPGWSGWTKELMNAACKADPQLYNELGELLACIQSSTDIRISSITRVGKLIALDNSKCASDTPDPRPITISEFFSKLLGLLAMKKARWSLHETQRGVCHKGGTHQAIVEIQHQYDKHQTRVVATFDVKNAFNSTSRESVHALLVRSGVSALHLLEYFRWMYGSKSDIFIRTRDGFDKYRSEQGVRQGDMPASLLFSLIFTEAAVRAGSGFEDILHTLWLYLDDVTLVATVNEVIAYKHRLAAELSPLQLHLNMRKCRVLADRCTPDEIALLEAEGFQLDWGCTRVLGSPVGTPEACKLWVSAKVTSWQVFWERLRHSDLHPAAALMILAKCGNVKFEHLAKSLSPAVTLDAAHVFDNMVIDTAAVILGLHKNQVSDYVIRAVTHLRPYTDIAGVLYECTLKTIEGVRHNSKVLVHEAICKRYESISLPRFVGPLIRSAQGSTASDTLRAVTAISAHDFAQGLRLRCGVAPSHVPTTCTCTHTFTDESVPVIAHLLTCSQNYEETMTTRHHNVVKAIQDVLFQFRITCVRENGKLHASKRPDLHILSLKKQVLIDVTIVDDVASCNGTLMDEAAARKHEHYDEMAESLGMRFFAVPISTYGRLHDETLKFFEHMAKHVGPHKKAELKSALRIAVQHALLEGNSRIVDRTVARLCDRLGNWLQ